MLRNIKLTIEYDGTSFNGWQIQPCNKRTVQGEIEKAIAKIFKKQIRLIGSGRTDSGVHALEQVANFKVSTAMSCQEIQKALNANIAKDVVILNVEEVPSNFHAQYSIKSKTYRYTILHRDVRCAVQRKFCLFYPYKLNLLSMRKEAKGLIGRYNFKSFQATDPAKRGKVMDTVRTVKRLNIRKKGNYIYIDIEANGFLYKMVRNIVGTLLDIGNSKLPKGSIKTILAQKSRLSAGATAPAQGLTLLKAVY
ncbi:tRNA pseudouridine(38-40) synthase [hydrothermal vent metagenome]|uniref:tRNA pseudouridine(38-40) synthase n=1 Tax=hydrothermal vent metagenome TaxID=652676 RepID=A0A3B1CZ84_9ZZZZ